LIDWSWDIPLRYYFNQKGEKLENYHDEKIREKEKKVKMNYEESKRSRERLPPQTQREEF